MSATPWDALLRLPAKPARQRTGPRPRDPEPGTAMACVVDAIRANPGIKTSDLVSKTGIKSPRIWGLLKRRLARGDVVYADGTWRLIVWRSK